MFGNKLAPERPAALAEQDRNDKSFSRFLALKSSASPGSSQGLRAALFHCTRPGARCAWILRLPVALEHQNWRNQ
jgi:hypothetical protein